MKHRMTICCATWALAGMLNSAIAASPYDGIYYARSPESLRPDGNEYFHVTIGNDRAVVINLNALALFGDVGSATYVSVPKGKYAAPSDFPGLVLDQTLFNLQLLNLENQPRQGGYTLSIRSGADDLRVIELSRSAPSPDFVSRMVVYPDGVQSFGDVLFGSFATVLPTLSARLIKLH